MINIIICHLLFHSKIQIFSPLTKILLHYFQQDSFSGCLFVINYSIYNHLKKYHSSPVQKYSPYPTSQYLRELKGVNAIALKILEVINLSVSMSSVCGAEPHFDGLGQTFFSDTQPAEKYFSLVPLEQPPNERINHLPNQMQNFQLTRLKKRKL